jgi:ribosomal-protein-serine acetyltransferase
MKQEVQLKSGFVLLRPYTLNDADESYSAVRESINELSPWMPWCHAEYSIEESRKWIGERADNWGKGLQYEFAITDSSSGLFLGGCGINNISITDRYANLGYWVRSTQTGRGIATTAASLLAKYGVKNLKLNRMKFIVAVGNKASQRVATKVGATREGILRNRIVVRDRIHDAVLFSIIPNDFNAHG